MDEDFDVESGAGADTETLSKLKEAGIDVSELEDVPETAEKQETAEKETPEKADTEEAQREPAGEDFEAEEGAGAEQEALLYGRFRSHDDMFSAYNEAERKIAEMGAQLRQYEPMMDAVGRLMQSDSGRAAMMAAMNAQPQAPAYLQDSTQFLETLAKEPLQALDAYHQTRMQPYIAQQNQMMATLNGILAHLESEAISKKYPDLADLRGQLDAVNTMLGPQAQYYPLEARVLMARGLGVGAKADASTGKANGQRQRVAAPAAPDKAQQEAARQRKIAATVETADEVGGAVAPVTTDNMSSKELRALIKKLGGGAEE